MSVDQSMVSKFICVSFSGSPHPQHDAFDFNCVSVYGHGAVETTRITYEKESLSIQKCTNFKMNLCEKAKFSFICVEIPEGGCEELSHKSINVWNEYLYALFPFSFAHIRFWFIWFMSVLFRKKSRSVYNTNGKHTTGNKAICNALNRKLRSSLVVLAQFACAMKTLLLICLLIFWPIHTSGSFSHIHVPHLCIFFSSDEFKHWT